MMVKGVPSRKNCVCWIPPADSDLVPEVNMLSNPRQHPAPVKWLTCKQVAAIRKNPSRQGKDLPGLRLHYPESLSGTISDTRTSNLRYTDVTLNPSLTGWSTLFERLTTPSAPRFDRFCPLR